MRKILIIIEIIAALGVAFGIYYVNLIHPKTEAMESEIVKKQDLVEEVSATGSVKSSQNVDLSFERSGRVATVNVKVGDQVASGQILASLDSSDLVAGLHQAQANLAVQQAQLDNLKKGARPEDIVLQQEKVSAAQNTLVQAQRQASDKIQSAFTIADDVIHNIGDQIFINPLSTNPKLVFILANVQLQTELESSRPNIEQMLNSWSLSLNGILSSADNLSSYLNTATANLNSIKSFLDEAADAVNTLSPNVQLTSATIQGWRTNISLARTNINGGSSALSAATQNLVVSQDGLRIAQDQLIQTQAGATDEQIKSQQQQVNSMQAALEAINIQISKTMVRSPLDGIITRCDATTGEVVSPNVPQITVISGGQFQIDVYVSEADIAKIKVGNPANVTLDTYGNGIIFEAKVISIDPAATLINGANDYKITLAFNDQDSRIKAGMTANADILTASVKQVLAAPKQAVITEGSDKYIMVEVGNSQPQKHKIEVGITGANGYVQIISGVSEGDRIISFISAK